MENNIPYNLFAKFFSGEISEKEQTLLDKFISENPENEKIFNEYEIIWSAETSSNKFNENTNNALKNVKSKFNKEIDSGKNNLKITYRIAAAVIIIFGLTYLGNELLINKNVKILTLESGNETLKKVLPDGSIVWLNINSSIEFPEEFTNDERKIKFKGEAYFKISHNPEKPFIIESENTETKVLGTEFNLRSSDSENIIELTLVEGKVLFTDTKTNESKTLNKEEIIKLNKNTRKIVKTKVSSTNHLYWKTKEIDLDGLSLKEIASELNTIFDINIKTDESVSDLIYYQSLPFKDSDASEILNIIKFTLNVKIDSINGSIILKKEN